MTLKKARSNAYSTAVFLTFLFAVPLLWWYPSLFPFVLNTPGILSTIAFVILSPIWISQNLAGAAYFGRFFDILFGEKPPETYLKTIPTLDKEYFKKRKGEFIGICLGILVAAAMTVCAVIYAPVTVVTVSTGFSVFSGLSFFLIMVGRMSGVFNRIGRAFVDFKAAAEEDKKTKPERGYWHKKRINYVLAVFGGLIVGTLFAIAMIATSGAVLPAVIDGAPFFLNAAALLIIMVSLVVSASSYIGRWFDALIGKQTLISAMFGKYENQKTLRERLFDPEEKNKWEYRLTLIGVPLGFMVSLVLTALTMGSMITGPFGLGHLSPIYFVPIIMENCFSTIGGMFWRLGYAGDHGLFDTIFQFFGCKKKEELRRYISALDLLPSSTALKEQTKHIELDVNVSQHPQDQKDISNNGVYKFPHSIRTGMGLFDNPFCNPFETANSSLQTLLDEKPLQTSSATPG